MKLNTEERSLIAHMKHFGSVQLSGCSEEMRRCLIDLGMREPPFVEVDGNWVSLTEAGLSALSRPESGPAT